jgi:NTE family protein
MQSPPTKTLSLALQGGGSHGAFTWGVLDRLLEDERLSIDGISGASAGAMNAVALADGYARGGREGARKGLRDFWTLVGARAAELFSAGFSGSASGELPPGLAAFLSLTYVLAPDMLDPYDLNPLRGIVSTCFDFEGLQRTTSPRVFVSATNVRTGRIRVFSNAELQAEVLLASSCLPSVHRTVLIDGEAYWDGGFSGNPPVFPLIFNCSAADVLVVMLQPLLRAQLPDTAEGIRERATELGFHAAFLREMRAIAISKDYIGFLPGSGRLEQRLGGLRLHIIEADTVFEGMSPKSKLNAMPEFLETLHAAGRTAASAWLERHFAELGVRSTVDLTALFA